MAIRKDGIVISDEVAEKLISLSFTNETNQYHSIEEVYLAKLIYDSGFNFKHLKSNYIFDIANKCVRYINQYTETTLYSQNNQEKIEIEIDKVFILPNWSELREYLKVKGFKMEFHYDPFKEINIKIGFMKPKFLTGTDNLIIEAQGKTDLETLYKVLLEVIKYENDPTA